MEDTQGEDRYMLVADLVARLRDRLDVTLATLIEAQRRVGELVVENDELRARLDALDSARPNTTDREASS